MLFHLLESTLQVGSLKPLVLYNFCDGYWLLISIALIYASFLGLEKEQLLLGELASPERKNTFGVGFKLLRLIAYI